MKVLQWDRAFDGAEMVSLLTCMGSKRFGEECERLFLIITSPRDDAPK